MNDEERERRARELYERMSSRGKAPASAWSHTLEDIRDHFREVVDALDLVERVREARIGISCPAPVTLGTGADTPWPLHEVLSKLADAADHLLRDHGCDTHGREEIIHARDAARGYLANREQVPQPLTEAVDPEDLWTDYRTERPGCGQSHRLAFLAGVEAGRRTLRAAAGEHGAPISEQTIARVVFESASEIGARVTRGDAAHIARSIVRDQTKTATDAPLTEAEARGVARFFFAERNQEDGDEEALTNVLWLTSRGGRPVGADAPCDPLSRGAIPPEVRPAVPLDLDALAATVPLDMMARERATARAEIEAAEHPRDHLEDEAECDPSVALIVDAMRGAK